MRNAIPARRAKLRNKALLFGAAAALSFGAAQAETLGDGVSIGGAAPPLASDAPLVAVEPVETERPIDIAYDAVSFSDAAVDRVRLSFIGPAFRPESDAIRTHVENLLTARRVTVDPDATDIPQLVVSLGGLGYVGAPSAEALSAHVESLLSPRRTATDSAAANAPWRSLEGVPEAAPDRRYVLLDGYGGAERGSEAKVSVFLPFAFDGAQAAPAAATSTMDVLLVDVQGEPLWQGSARGAFGGMSIDFAAESLSDILVGALRETRRDAQATVMAPLPVVNVESR